MPDEKKLRSLYIDDDRWEKLKYLAKIEGRSVNNYMIEIVINNHLDENEKEIKKGKQA